MPRDPVLVNNPFMEETDDKFRKIFFGNTKEKKDSESESEETVKNETSESTEQQISKPSASVGKTSFVPDGDDKSVSENTHKKNISSTAQPVSEKQMKKRLERHNFKIYSTQVQKLRDVAQHLKDVRGDEVKADMSGILRYLVDSLDIEKLTEEYPKRP